MPSSLPAALTPLIGRAAEISSLQQLVAAPSVRLVTLTGPGGVGKTRLALAAAHALAPNYPDGVHFISLASLTDPSLVLPTIAAEFGLRADTAARSALAEHLRDLQVLLCLDNFEQLLPAAAALVEMLTATRFLKIIITSRVVLHVRGEYEFPVPTLQTSQGANPAVDLFLERARAVNPQFAPTDAERVTINTICERLDGLPLAIELAAARLKFLSPVELAARLENRFAVLTDGARDLPLRQQTLRNTLAWSYELLDPIAQRVFCRLGIFAGGCALSAAEQVCDASLEMLSALVDHSLLQSVRTDTGESRFLMLETIREYAREQLAATEEYTALARAHRIYFASFAENAAPHLVDADQKTWLDALELEHNNLRAALSSSIETADAETALRLGAALSRFWYARGFLNEGYRWLEQALSLSANVSPRILLAALNATGMLAATVGKYARTAAVSETGLALARAQNDPDQIVAALSGLGNASLWTGDYDRALACFGESVQILRETANPEALTRACAYIAFSYWFKNEMDTAAPLFQSALDDARRLGDRWCIGFCLYGLAFTLMYRGKYEAARSSVDQSYTVFSQLLDRRSLIRVFAILGILEGKVGNVPQAWMHNANAFALAREIGELWSVAVSGGELANWVLAHRDTAFGVQLVSAFASFRQSFQAVLPRPIERDQKQLLDEARRKLGARAFDHAVALGRSMTLEQVIDALEAVSASLEATPTPSAPTGLSPRELEVLSLVAAGLTDAEIAEELVISLRTVHTHVSNILSKLGVKSRVGAARYAVANGLSKL